MSKIRNSLNEIKQFNFGKYRDEHGEPATLMAFACIKYRAIQALEEFENKLQWIDSVSTDNDVRAWAQDELNDKGL